MEATATPATCRTCRIQAAKDAAGTWDAIPAADRNHWSMVGCTCTAEAAADAAAFLALVTR